MIAGESAGQLADQHGTASAFDRARGARPADLLCELCIFLNRQENGKRTFYQLRARVQTAGLFLSIGPSRLAGSRSDEKELGPKQAVWSYRTTSGRSKRPNLFLELRELYIYTIALAIRLLQWISTIRPDI